MATDASLEKRVLSELDGRFDDSLDFLAARDLHPVPALFARRGASAPPHRTKPRVRQWGGREAGSLASLVRQPSTLGHEQGVQELVFARMRSLGLAAEKWDLEPELLRGHPAFGALDLRYDNRPNVTARWCGVWSSR